MNSTIENPKRQSLTKLAGFGFVKLVGLALIAVSFLLSDGTDFVVFARTLDGNTEIVNPTGNEAINTNGFTLTFNNTEDTTFAGGISGSGNVVKIGDKMLTLTSPAIYYRGTTTVSGGTLYLKDEEGLLWFSSEIINNGVIETNKAQRFNNLNGTGTIHVTSPGNPAKLDLYNATRDTTYSGSITGDAALDIGGGKMLTLSGSISDVNSIIVRNKSQLKLTGTALDYNGPMDVNGGKSVEYNVVSGSKRYNINNDNKIDVRATSDGGTDSGKLIKSGDGTLQICCEADGAVRADSVFISSGRMDYQGYFESVAGPGSATDPKEIFVVEEGATFSPGIGIGNATFVESNLSIRNNAIALFEFGAYSEDPAQQNFDTITIATATYRFVTSENSIINLAFTNNDVEQWAQEGSEYRIVIAEEQTFEGVSIAGDYSNLLGNYKDYFKLVGRDRDGFYLIGLGVPEPVPEPSTWALLILGAAGLICVQLRKKK